MIAASLWNSRHDRAFSSGRSYLKGMDFGKSDNDRVEESARRLFERQSVFPFAIAFFAARHEISLRGFAPPNDRHQMVHGEFSGWKFSAAVVANSRRALALPPRASAQISRLAPLSSDVFVRHRDQKRARIHVETTWQWPSLVPPLQIFEINTKTRRDEHIKNCPKESPMIVRAQGITQLPQGKSKKEHHRGRYQNPVGREQPHNAPMKHQAGAKCKEPIPIRP